MKLVVSVVHQRDRGRLSEELIGAGFKFSILPSTGGFLGESNALFLVGVDEDDVPTLLKVIEANCKSREQVMNVPVLDSGPVGGMLNSPMTVPVGGAVVWVLPVDQFVHF